MILQPIQPKAIFVLLAIVAFGPIIASWFVLRQNGTTSNYTVLWVIVAISVVGGMLIGGSLLRRTLTIGENEITVKTTFYSRTIKISEITDVERITPEKGNDVIGMRSNGVGLPGFQSGWFVNRSGGQVFVDRTEGDYLLISVGQHPKIAIGVKDTNETMDFIKRKIRSE